MRYKLSFNIKAYSYTWFSYVIICCRVKMG